MSPLHLFVEGLAYAALVLVAGEFVIGRARARLARRRDFCDVDAWARHRADLRRVCDVEIVRGPGRAPSSLAAVRPGRARTRTAR